ncbi:MAG: RNA-binding protein [Chitinophagaceae bacterium]|nr:MAG: RNA-binding protein [Chitinophagaceae bacterium]
MNIYVSNLGFGVQSEDLKQLFSTFGSVSSANIIMDRATGRSRGFGFVEMPDKEAAEKAIKELDGSMMEGRSIKANEAKPREQSSSRNSFY